MKRIALFFFTLVITTLGFAGNRVYRDAEMQISVPIPEGLEPVVDLDMRLPVGLDLKVYSSNLEAVPVISLALGKIAIDEPVDLNHFKGEALELIEDLEFGLIDIDAWEIPARCEGAIAFRFEANTLGQMGRYDVHIIAEDAAVFAIITTIDSGDLDALDALTGAIIGSVTRES